MNARRALWLVVLAAFALRVGLLMLRGDYLVYDEGYYLLLARSLRESHTFSLNGLPHVALSPLQPMVVAGLSMTGVPDLWASRLLAALCGALLVLPVAWLARRWFGERAALGAAALTAASPALLTFLPFFPGERWNLYFGSEPLYLLLAVCAVACAVRAADGGPLRCWLAAGALAAAAYLTRLEGVVLAAVLLAAVVVSLVARGRIRLWPRALAALAVGALIAAPYLAYLHATLGCWAISGRVQAASAAGSPAGVAERSGGSDAVNAFVWGGDTQALWRTLYALDASGTRMASQYWGVPRGAPGPGGEPSAAGRETPVRDSAASTQAAPPRASRWTSAARALLIVVPLWVLVLAAYGFVRVPERGDAALWLSPLALAAAVPAALAYAEPRALLALVPVATVLGAGGVADLAARVASRLRHPAAVPVAFGVVAALFLAPTVRDAARAWSQQTPLQQVATAQRAVGEYVGGHSRPDGPVMSWHPAIAVWARRDWRVLPYEPFDRVVGYARSQRAAAMVFSRFNPSPLRDAPRAFTIVLPGEGGRVPAGRVHLEMVDETPLLFVGRLAGGTP